MITFTTADVDLTGNPRVNSIMGFHITAGAAASVSFFNGDPAVTGEEFIRVEVPASTSRHFAANRPIIFPRGLYIQPNDANVAVGGVVPG